MRSTRGRAYFPTVLLVVAGLCFWLLGPLTAAALASPPPNDNFLDSDNLNAPGRPLPTVNTLSSSVDTRKASTQPDLLDPCGEFPCQPGPAEQSTCKGVSYGKTVWYDFYPDHAGQIEIRTSGIANVIALYTYEPNSLIPTPVTCAKGSKYHRNELSEDVHRGVDYTVQIGGRNSAGGLMQVLFNYVYRSHLTVPPFLTGPGIRPIPRKQNIVRLENFKFVGVAAGETISAACGFCVRGDLRERVRHGNFEVFEGSKPIISRRSRLLIAATAPAQIGRFKVYAYVPHRGSLLVVSQGCLAPGVTRVSQTDAEHLAALPRISCPVRLVNPIGGEYVFWRSKDGQLEEKWYSGTKWSPTIRLKFGGLTSQPSAAVHVKGEQDVFWRGRNGKLRETWYNGEWHHPINFGGRMDSPPTAGADGSGKEYVFWKGSDGGLWERWFADGRWTRPQEVRNAGFIGSAPTVAVHSDGEQDVFWKGANGNLMEIIAPRANGGWGTPLNRGGGLLGSAPSAGADAAGNDYVVWRGSNDRLWAESSLAGRWNDEALPVNAGVLGSPPSIAVQADGEQDVFWKGAGDHLWEISDIGNVWQGAVSHGGHLTSQPGAGVDAAGKQATAKADRSG